MATVTAFEAKTRFGDLLARVARGEEIVITRHERPVARLIPEGRAGLAQVREAVSQLRQLRKDMAKRRGFKPISGKEIKDAINTGRP